MTTRMSKTRALATIKSLEAKIRKATENTLMIAVGEGKDHNRVVVGAALAVEALSERIVTEFQSLQDMLAQRDAIKAALIKSNAETVVEIGSRSMTVAEAIEAKRSMEFKAQLLANMRKQLHLGTSKYNAQKGQYDAKYERLQDSMAMKDKRTSEDEVKMQLNLLELKSVPFLIDPLGLEALIKQHDEEYQDFATNVDFVLSESNASTFIEVA
ncbi:tail fiber protein [Yersinia phage phiR2-01]|uniref:Phage tail fiber protein n=1 Tax=Yersinia phage phiR2-01 TaxID=1206557 RepID=I7LEE5_9CAUD|nr:tail fiber protein [Yersinia phage phiR2-01]CCI88502.1 Phage tail fiber protein [Yersinia phage phiR2-01]